MTRSPFTNSLRQIAHSVVWNRTLSCPGGAALASARSALAPALARRLDSRGNAIRALSSTLLGASEAGRRSGVDSEAEEAEAEAGSAPIALSSSCGGRGVARLDGSVAEGSEAFSVSPQRKMGRRATASAGARSRFCWRRIRNRWESTVRSVSSEGRNKIRRRKSSKGLKREDKNINSLLVWTSVRDFLDSYQVNISSLLIVTTNPLGSFAALSPSCCSSSHVRKIEV